MARKAAAKSEAGPRIPAEVKRLLAKPRRGVDSAALLNAIIEAWGGHQKLAFDAHTEYQAAKPGSMTRQRILEMITRLTVQVTTQDIAKPKDLDTMSIEDLEAEAFNLMLKMRGRTDGLASSASASEG
ncbi:MAG: hypothetical protein IRY99_23815 [Isosphaeraceae bacterium]|nr:hypothetical protein [Isosphaeraceae bacterium]